MAEEKAKKAAEPQASTDTPKVEVPADLLERLLEKLASEPTRPETVTNTTSPEMVSISSAGKTVGVINKYPLDPDFYPNPVDFLLNLPTLSRFNLPENYEMAWRVEGTQYETKWGSFIEEPRFFITLYRKAFDEEGNRIEGKRYLIKEMQFTEDESVARMIAREMGIDLKEVDMRSLLNQVRMKRMQNWLEEIFKPRNNLRAKTKKMEVIGGMTVQVEEYETEV